jgi:hypothetical protein
MAQRYQNGHLRVAKRKCGPDVWEFLWREQGPDGKQRQKTITVGNVQKLPTHREAMNQIHMLRMNINRDAAITSLLTFQALVDHYCQTELLAENKTEKTRKTYRTYLQRWILPKWGPEYLHLIKPILVEQWLRSVEGLSDGSKAKIRNIMSAFSPTQSASK